MDKDVISDIISRPQGLMEQLFSVWLEDKAWKVEPVLHADMRKLEVYARHAATHTTIIWTIDRGQFEHACRSYQWGRGKQDRDTLAKYLGTLTSQLAPRSRLSELEGMVEKLQAQLKESESKVKTIREKISFLYEMQHGKYADLDMLLGEEKEIEAVEDTRAKKHDDLMAWFLDGVYNG